MNILVPDSWLRQYLETPATPSQIKDSLSLCGPSVERVEKKGDDYIYEIEITSNRVDMASVLGIAREAAAILPKFGIPAKLKTPKLNENINSESSETLPLEVIDENKLCYRVLAIVINNVKVSKSPDLIRDRLEKSGLRCLNNLIDITNYVMLELGHPTHVFDYDRIKTGKLIIRKAKKDEEIVTFDGKHCPVDERDVVIDDGTGRLIDLPGIMGTENSVVTDQTHRIVFFIESNNAVNIRRTSMRLSLRTLAATINEKRPDPETAKMAMLRGIELFKKFTGGKINSNLIDLYPSPSQPKQIKVSTLFINERLGIELTKSEIVSILESLSFQVSEQTKSGSDLDLPKGLTSAINVTPPSFRQFDVAIPEDIVEEVARIYGYHNLPGQLMEGKIPVFSQSKDLIIEDMIKKALKFWGYTEVYNYSFISKELIVKTGMRTDNHLKLSNPLTSEIEYMRLSLIPSLIETFRKNINLKKQLQFFELAKVYVPQITELPKESSMLGIITNRGFYEIKGVIDALLKEIGVAGYKLSDNLDNFWHPTQSASFNSNNQTIARFGRIHPDLVNNFILNGDCFLAELNIDSIKEMPVRTKKYSPIPLYPPAIEDLTLYLPLKTKIGDIIAEIKRQKLITKVELVDNYKNSVTLRITYQDPNRNLTSQNIRKLRLGILSELLGKFKVSLKTKN